MNKNSISFGIIGLLVGLAVGFFVANSINKNATQTLSTSQSPNNQPKNPKMSQPQTSQRPKAGMQADVQSTLDKAASEPNNYEAQIAAGKMHAQIQRYDRAIEYFQKAQKLKPADFAANALLGNAYYDAKQFEDAETFYEKALNIKSDANVQSDYATTFFKRSNPDNKRAIIEFKKALEINPKHEATFYNMAIAYLKMNDKENANKTLEKLKEANSESNLILRLENAINRN